MPSAFIARRVAAIIASHGEAMTLRRAGEADIAVRAKRCNARGDAIVGTMTDQVVTIRISNAEIAGSAAPARFPRRGDTIGAFAIDECDTRKDGETVLLHILLVGGTG